MSRLFEARSIAIVGASADASRIGGRPLDYLLKSGFPGRIHPVNPSYDTVQGVPCHRSIEAIGEPVDVAIIAVSANRVIESVRSLGTIGAGYAMIFSAGFAETGPDGRVLQEELVAVAAEAGVRIIGPNSVGYTSAGSQIVGSFASTWLRDGSLPLAEGSVSFVTHSGAFGGLIYSMAEDEGLTFRHFLNVGNECDVTFSEGLEYMIADDRVAAVGGYMEGLKDGTRFLAAAARANDLGKPVVMIKVGRSERAQQAAASHTASLVGSDSTYGAAFAQTNVIRVEDVQEMLDILHLAQAGVLPARPRIAVVSISGGLGVWAADQAGLLGLPMAEFTPETRAKLDAILPTYGSSLNPVDATAQLLNDPSMLRGLLAAVQSDPGVDLVYLAMGLQEQAGERFAADVIEVTSGSATPMVISWVCGPEKLYELFSAAGLAVFKDFHRPLLALSRISRWAVRRAERGADAATLLMRKRSAAHAQYSPAEHVDALAEDVAKARLAKAGPRVPPSRRVTDPGDAAAVLAELGGGPVVLKAAAPDRVVHKTDLGLVKANLATPEELAAAITAMTLACTRHLGDSGYLFAEQQSDDGIDLIVSLLRDDVFGPYVVLGAGGVLVDLTAEVGQHLAPFDHADAVRLIHSVDRLPALLAGVRGAPAADVDALVEALVRISHIDLDDPEAPVNLLEINPLRVLPRGDGVVALDAVWTLPVSTPPGRTA
jgi:acetyltransferase